MDAFFILISIHTPARGVTGVCRRRRCTENISIHTPARGVTSQSIHLIFCFRISIHTPARGVTLFASIWRSFWIISIHTPARGVTSLTYTAFKVIGNFNPHSRKGSDGEWKDCDYEILHFNPHSRKGSDNYDFGDILYVREFQSTLPQGE